MAWSLLENGSVYCEEHAQEFSKGDCCDSCFGKDDGDDSHPIGLDAHLPVSRISQRANLIYRTALGPKGDRTTDPKRLAVALSALRLQLDISLHQDNKKIANEFNKLIGASRHRSGPKRELD